MELFFIYKLLQVSANYFWHSCITSVIDSTSYKPRLSFMSLNTTVGLT
jgi:hypothetical protein